MTGGELALAIGRVLAVVGTFAYLLLMYQAISVGLEEPHA
jgi:hypothetical protein